MGLFMKRRLLFLAAGALLLIVLRPPARSIVPAPPPPAPAPAVLPEIVEPTAARPLAPAPDLRRLPLVHLVQDAGDRERPIAGRPPAPPETDELLIFLQPGADPRAFAADHGLQLKAPLAGVKDIYVFTAATPAAAKAARGRAAGDLRVQHAFLNERTMRVHCAFIPDDPYLPDNSPAPFHGQWHLGNGASPFHANLTGAWNRDVTGLGVLIGIVDDCLETAHP